MASPIVRVAVGILQRGDTYLIAERPAGKPYAGYWEFPGGKIELDETDEAAIRRELNEELAITVDHAEFMFEHEHTYPDKTVQLYLWRITKFQGEPISNEDQILKWVTIPEMQNHNLLEGNWPLLDKILSY